MLFSYVTRGHLAQHRAEWNRTITFIFKIYQFSLERSQVWRSSDSRIREFLEWEELNTQVIDHGVNSQVEGKSSLAPCFLLPQAMVLT